MKVATVTYNRHASFTNYGSALQTWALRRCIETSVLATEAVCLDYCPDSHSGRSPLRPLGHMWDTDDESADMVRLSMPAIVENHAKFERFYEERCVFTDRSYTSEDVGESLLAEGLDGYVCGSDTIFCIREFGPFDRGFFADAPEMRGRAVAYAASFGDVDWTREELETLSRRLANFRALGLREGGMVGFARETQECPVARTCDPTLLLRRGDYLEIAAGRQHDGPYVLLYSRRHDPAMEDRADEVAAELGCDVVEISLRATNAEQRGHEMRYDAGVEEYLALVRDASHVVTNSYHGLAVALQMGTPFTVYMREQAETKTSELLSWLGLEGRACRGGGNPPGLDMSFDEAYDRLEGIREDSLAFLRLELSLLGAR